MADKTQWPKREKLIQALDVFERFREQCKLQMDLGYWVTMDFPTKNHLNKILSFQYLDRDVAEKIYGSTLTARTYDMVPSAKNYIKFIQDTHEIVATKK